MKRVAAVFIYLRGLGLGACISGKMDEYPHDDIYAWIGMWDADPNGSTSRTPVTG